MKPHRVYSLLTVTALALGASLIPAKAANIFLIDNNSTGQSWNTLADWNTQSDGSGSTPGSISASDDYFTNGFALRTPTASSIFGGNSITIDSGNALQLRNTSGNTATVNNLIFGGGDILSAAATQQALTVTNTLSVNSNIILGAASGRGISLTATTLTGSAQIRTGDTASDSGTYRFVFNDASGFTGQLRSIRGVTDFDAETVMLNGSWFVNNSTVADVIIDENISIGALDIGALSVANGVYTAAELNALTTGDPFSGNGLVGVGTVVPEPSTAASLILAGMAFNLFRRQRQQK